MKIDPNKPVGEIAVELDGAIELFQERKIDYSFGGRRGLRSACDLAGVRPEEILARLEKMEALTWPLSDWDERSLASIVDQIVRREHPYIRLRLAWFRKKTGDLGIGGSPHLVCVLLRDLVDEMAREMEAHMKEEETVVFPHLIEMERRLHFEGDPKGSPSTPGQGRPVPSTLPWDHTTMWKNWVLVQELIGHYHTPIQEDQNLSELFRRLREFQDYIRDHTHLEDNVLFRKAVQAGFLAHET